MKNKFKSIALMSYSVFDLKSLVDILHRNGYSPFTRSCAYTLAKRLRIEYPDVFIRILKVDNSYYIISDEDEYNDFWEFRKIAMRNERKMKNEIV